MRQFLASFLLGLILGILLLFGFAILLGQVGNAELLVLLLNDIVFVLFLVLVRT